MEAGPVRATAVRLLISRAILRAQINEFLESAGILCSESAVNPTLLISDAESDGWEQVAEEAARLGARALILCNEPESVARSVIRQPWVDFLERPFAWRELRARIDAPAA